MTRPILGREDSVPVPARPYPFPVVLASALDRISRGAGVPPTGVSPASPARLPDDGPAPPGAAAARRPAVRSRPGAGPGQLGLVRDVGPAARDTPGSSRDHLIETVEPDAVPLWRAFLEGRGPVTRRRLVEHHTSLVRGVGSKLAVRLPSSIELSDLLQSGTFGLMEAVDRFDPARGVRFEGYAAQRIRGAMLDELRAQDWVPRTVRARSREVERAREAVQSRTGRPASDRELAAELGIGLRELRHAGRPLHLVSVDELGETSVAGAGGATALVTGEADDPLLAAARKETGDELRAAIAQLGERDRTVLRLYYLEDHTLAEIGVLLGVTESRVCQLHARMLTRLRSRMRPARAG